MGNLTRRPAWPVALDVAAALAPILALWRTAAVALVVAALLAIALLRRLILRENPRMQRLVLLDAAAAVFLLSRLLSGCVGFYSANSQAALLPAWTAVGLYIAVRLATRPHRQIIWTISLVWLAVYAVLALLTLLQFNLLQIMLDLVGFRQPIHFKYLFQPFGFYINGWATLFLFLLPAPLYCFYFHHQRWLQIAAFCAAVAFLAVVLISFSRGLYLALALLLLLTCTGLCILHSELRRSRIRRSGLLLAALALLAIPIREPAAATLSFFCTVSQVRSASGRVRIWAESRHMLRENPLVGVGAGNFALCYPLYRSAACEAAFVSRAFNSYVQIACEGGAVAIAAFGALIAAFLRAIRCRLQHRENELERAAVWLWFSATAALLAREICYTDLFAFDALVLHVFVVLAWAAAEEGDARGI